MTMNRMKHTPQGCRVGAGPRARLYSCVERGRRKSTSAGTPGVAMRSAGLLSLGPCMLRVACRLAVLIALAPVPTSAQAPAPPDTTTLQRLLAAEDARGTGPDGLSPLLDARSAPDTLLRRLAVRGLGRMQRPALGRLLVPLLHDSVAAV